MIPPPLAELLLFAASSLLAGSLDRPAPPAVEGDEYAQLSFHSRVVIRVETLRQKFKVHDPYREKKGPDCVTMSDVAGAIILAPASVDMVMRGGSRVRARFAASCPALDYYSGFYIVPNADGRICVDRDVVRDRAGGECGIDKFRTLVPRK